MYLGFIGANKRIQYPSFENIEPEPALAAVRNSTKCETISCASLLTNSTLKCKVSNKEYNAEDNVYAIEHPVQFSQEKDDLYFCRRARVRLTGST